MQFYPYSDMSFTLDEWHKRQQEMAVVEEEMKALAASTGWTFESSRKYPVKTLKRRRGFQVFRIVVFLRFAAGEPADSYEFGVGSEKSIFGLYSKAAGYKSVSILSVAEVQNGDLVRAALRSAYQQITSEI